MHARVRLLVSATAVALGVAGATVTKAPSIASAAGGPVIAANAIGMHYINTASSAWPSATHGSVRLWDDGFMWRQLQPKSGAKGWDTRALSALDGMLVAAHDRGKDVVVVLGQSPDWAVLKQCNATGQVSSAIYGAKATCAPDDSTGAINTGPWTAYVKKVLGLAHGSYITALEMWNEADYPSYYNDTPAALAQLTDATRRAVKSMGRTTLVSAPSLGTRNNAAHTWLDAYLAASRTYAMPFDVVNLHLYPIGTSGPESMLAALSDAKTLMASYGVSAKPIWDTEVAAGYQPTAMMTGDDIAGQPMRDLLVDLTSGISRTFWYAWNDPVTGGFGGDPINNGDVLTDAGVGWDTAAGWLVGSQVVSPVQQVTTVSTDPNRYVWFCDLTLPTGEHARAVWNYKWATQAISYTVPDGATQVIDWQGVSTPVTGGTVLPLHGYPLLLVGSF